MVAEGEPGAAQELTGWRRTALRVARTIEPEGDASEAIYGTLIAAGVLATKAQSGESGAVVLWSALLVLGLYWIAHVYADVVGERLSTRTRPGWSAILSTVLRDWSMLRGSLVPVAVFAVVRGFGASVNASGLAALWVTVALLGCWWPPCGAGRAAWNSLSKRWCARPLACSSSR